jgi:hypothetical protein
MKTNTNQPRTKRNVNEIIHFKEMNLTNHRITVTEFKDGYLTVSICPRNDSEFDTTSILHDVNDRVLRIATLRKVKVIE